jgi:hypothetical protein
VSVERLEVVHAEGLGVAPGAAVVDLLAVDVEPVNILRRPPVGKPPPAFEPERAIRSAVALTGGGAPYPDNAAAARVELALGDEALKRARH